MRDVFPGYFTPTPDDFKQMWDEALVSVDANILLHVYRYSEPLRESLFKLLEKLGDRLWITPQAAEEFLRNRLTVIGTQAGHYHALCKALDEGLARIKGACRHHPIIDVSRAG